MAATIQNIEHPKKPRARDTSGNNNHGQIYSGRALEFDGVTDYFQNNGGVALAGVNQFADGVPWTFACWMYLEESDDNYFVGNDGTSHPHLIFDDDQFKIRDATANKDYYSFSLATTEKNTWHRVVITTDGDSVILYINGVVYGTITSSTEEDGAGTNLFPSTAMEFSGWGTPYASSGTRVLGFKGMMSDGQVWDSTWSAADVTYDYLNPESLALNASGTALTESNLKVWYPMQDGHRGQQSYILDGANTGLGVEELTNGSFTGITQAESTTGSEWTTNAGWSIGDGVILAEAGNATKLVQTNTLNGKFCKVTLTVSNYGGAGLTLVDFGSVSSSYITSNGTHSVYGTYDQNNFEIYKTDTFSGTIDNISVKAINDKHHATTVFYGDELVTNGEFTNNITDGWTVDATRGSYAHDTGRIKITNNAASSYPNCSQDIATVIGRTYRVRGGVEIGTATTVEIRALRSGDNASQQLSADGNIDFTFVADQTSTKLLCYLWAPTGNTAEYVFFDNISFQEVGVASGWTDADQQLHIPQTALQSYNELAWFDGTTASNGYVDLDSAITTSGNSWSLSFWVFHDDNGQAFDFIAGNGTNQIITLTRAGTDFLSYRDSSDAYHTISDAAIPESEWVHITITATANTSITAYVNGVAQTTNSDMTNTTLLLKRFMRGFSANLYHVFGTINEISYYSDVLTAAEVLDLFNDGKAKSALEASGSAGLVGYWRNNGLSEWKDLKGSNDGNTSAGVVETILIPEGVDTTRDSQGFLMNKKRSTSSLNLTDGYDNPYVDLGSTTTVADDEASSFVMWLKPDDLTNNHIFGLDTSNTFLISNSTTITKQADGEAKYFSTSLVAYEWVHIAVVKKASNDLVTIYKDGTALTDTETLNEPFDYRYLGAKDSTNSFRGSIDGFLIYNSELSATEVLQNYNATKRDHKN